MFIAAGASLTTFTFRRDGRLPLKDPRWQDLDLGTVEHARFAGRVVVYLKALWKMAQHRTCFRQATVVHARNLDLYCLLMLVLALFNGRSRAQASSRVYEALDVHFALTGNGMKSRLLRAVERYALRHADLLLTSSPGFITNYFEPVQNFHGAWYLVENKLSPAVMRTMRPTIHPRPSGAPFNIAWVGHLRCPVTLAVLVELAKSRADRVRIRIAGRVSRFILHDFDEQIAAFDNIEFTGTFSWPEGLASVYDNIDLCWSQDAHKLSENSGWLIPNRLYEAGYFSVPCIAVAGTQTARMVDDLGLGFVIDEASSQSLTTLIDKLQDADIDDARQRIQRIASERFVANEDDAQMLLASCIRRADNIV